MSEFKVLEGWKLVPVEPTLEMVAAMAFNGDVDVALGHATICQGVEHAYAAMLAAAPAAPELVLADRQQRGGDVAAVLSQFLTGDGFIAACDIPHIVHALERYATPVAAQVPKRLLYRLRKHADDDRNSAFARSTMREALQYLAAAQPAHPDASVLVEALEQIIRQYPNPDVSHVDFRVHACKHAEHALAEYHAALAGKGGE